MLGFDLPGHGQSGGKRGYCSYQDAVEEIDCLMAETNSRFPGQPKFIYGHSLGGAMVLYYTLMRTPQVAGTIVTSPGLGAKVPGWKAALAKSMSKVYPTFALSNGLDRQNLSHDPSVIQAYGSDPLVHDRVTTRLGWDALSIGPEIVSMAGRYPVPLLLMQGSEDHIVSLQAVDEFAKNAPQDKITYKRWDGLYHETHNEPQKAQVIQAMIDWLNQHTEMVY
jgi:alpha-beta hydrolase superfamily lysophospholipase